MTSRLHHVAVNSTNFDQTVQFFQEVFQMEISRTRGDTPFRQLWFQQGIQVNEVPETFTAAGSCDHIGIEVSSKEEILSKIPAFGCSVLPNKPHWFVTPEGFVIELM